MLPSKLVQNPVIVQNIFRRLSQSTNDLRRSSNFQNKTTTCHFTKPINSLNQLSLSEDCKGKLSFRRRSYSTGHQTTGSNKSVTDMATELKEPAATKLNRLAKENSPYLLQHASNPVDWYPWGEEAFDKAKTENKLIFLSVGYSTCHWCHVMEKESFENDEVAKILNEHYVSIKVDREERPDVDRMYMSFIQAAIGGGGWPMTVFLTPSLEPVTGGTYFPPDDKYGRPGFKTVLTKLAEQWNKSGSEMLASGARILQVLKRATESQASESSNVPGEKVWTSLFKSYANKFDSVSGGFSRAPKFPQPSNLNFLLHLYSLEKDSDRGKQCLDMVLHTLKKMAYGGIHDHVNCGFARYSVDKDWHVPHFEKMLYDQGQLVVSFLDAFVITKDTFFEEIVHDILKYLERDLSHEEGGFYGAEDADSYPYHGAKHKQEGAFCVWEYTELCNLLSQETVPGIPDYEIFNTHYNVKKEGNVNPTHDPHGELLNKNVLSCFTNYEDTASKFTEKNVTIQQIRQVLDVCHNILYEERKKRPKPHVDTKIVTSWNGLAISGFAKAGFTLNNQHYIDRAILATEFIRKNLFNPKTNTLTRCCYKGDDRKIAFSSNPIPAFLDDYAFFIRGLLDLYEASLDAKWLEFAETLQFTQDKLFWDEKGAGYYSSPAGDPSILIRGKEDQDGAEPCGNSVAVHNLIRIAAYLHRQDLKIKAGRILSSFSEMLDKIPLALPEMVSGLMFYHQSPPQVFICGKMDEENTQALLDVLRNRFLPGRMLAVADGPQGKCGLLYSKHETLARLKPVKGKPAAYVCRNFACTLPVVEPRDLAESLEKKTVKADIVHDQSALGEGSVSGLGKKLKERSEKSQQRTKADGHSSSSDDEGKKKK